MFKSGSQTQKPFWRGFFVHTYTYVRPTAGGVLVAAAHFGAHVMGTDINRELLHGRSQFVHTYVHIYVRSPELMITAARTQGQSPVKNDKRPTKIINFLSNANVFFIYYFSKMSEHFS